MPIRKFILAVLAVVGALAGLTDVAPAQAARRTAPAAAAPAITVDVSRLRFLGARLAAERIAASMPDALARAFAGRPPPGRLVVRVSLVSLASFPVRSRPNGPSPTDYIQGSAVLIGGRGEVLASSDILTALNADSGGSWLLPGNEIRRIDALAEQFAFWTPRQLGLR